MQEAQSAKRATRHGYAAKGLVVMKKLVLSAAMIVCASAAVAEQGDQLCFEKGTLTYQACEGGDKADFEGAYLGASAGFGSVSAGGLFDELDKPSSPWNTDGDFDTLFFSDMDVDGGLYGAYVGYNWDAGDGVIVGVEIDVSAGDVQGRIAEFDEVDDRGAGVAGAQSLEGEINYTASARGRAGIVFDKFMPFVTGGVGVVDYDYVLTDEGGNGGNRGREVLSQKFNETAIAPVVGGGVEWAVDGDLTFRVEGQYYVIDDEYDLDTILAGEGDPGDNLNIEDLFVIRAGAGWLF